MVSIQYQVGGSLKQDYPFYVVRQADNDLYDALQQGEFCYALNARQMGKSSLLVRTKHRLKQAGVRCAVIDMTGIGSELVTPEQWYKGIAYTLWMEFDLVDKIPLKSWWQQHEGMSEVQRLGLWFSTLLLTFPQQNLVIFIDEIDSVLSLSFPVDDFFALIRFCYNQRAIDSAYERLTFALFGVATPADLIHDKSRTPFNIGKAIELHGFQLQDAEPLAAGLKEQVSNPHALLQEILHWTDGQPFLTQKLCYLIAQAAATTPQRLTIPPGTEGFWVENLVQTHVIQNWESQDEPEHLGTIRDRLLRHPQRAGQRLGLYQRVLYPATPGDGSELGGFEDSQEHIELLLSGLVVKRQGKLQVGNRIYRAVFDADWVERQFAALRPYSHSITAWAASGQQDSSRLLRGQALVDAQIWADGKHLSSLDYQFLTASQAIERQNMQQALEAERLHLVEARLQAVRSSARRQRSLLMLVTLALALSLSLGLMTFSHYRQAALNEIRAIASASELFYTSSQGLDALVSALNADARLRSFGRADAETQSQVAKALRQAVYNAAEINRFTGHQSAVGAVGFSPDEQLLASGSEDRTVRLWRRDGTSVQTLYGHSDRVWAVEFDRTGERLASGSEDQTVILWGRDGSKLHRLIGHNGGVTAVAFSPDGELLASASTDRTVKLWARDGTLRTTLEGHSDSVRAVAFSSDGQRIATASDDGTLMLWSSSGQRLTSFPAHADRIRAVAFSPSGGNLASAGDDATIRIWTAEGKLLHTLRGHQSAVHSLSFSPYGQLIASASRDHTIKLWNRDGLLLATLRGHDKPVRSVAFSQNGRTLASAGDDETIRLWKINNIFLTPLIGHEASVTAVAFRSSNRTVITASEDKTIRFWNRRGALLQTLTGHDAGILDVTVSPDDRRIASTSADGVMKLWTIEGQLLQSIAAHRAAAWAVAFSPNDQVIATGSDDRMVKLWNPDGTLRRELSGHVGGIRDLSFSPQAPLMASVSVDGAIRLWRNNHVVLPEALEPGWRTDSDLLSSFGDYSAEILAAAFSPNRPLLATAWDKTIKLWRTDGTLLKTLRGHQGKVRDVVFSPDGRLLASASDDSTVKLWTADGVELTTLDNHTAAVRSLAFSPDGQTLASVSEDRTGLLWDLQLVLETAALRKYGCDWVRDYVQTSAEVATRHRQLCRS